MSGHNKWSSIKHKKKIKDEKKSKLFSKLADNIKTTLKNGNDLNQNSKLKNAVCKALNNNISKSVISKIIKKETSENKEKILFNVILQENVIFIIECLSDNKNKTTSEIKNIFSKRSGQIVQFKEIEYAFKKNLKINLNYEYNEEHFLNKIPNSIIKNFNNDYIILKINNINEINYLKHINYKTSFIFVAKKKIKVELNYLKELKIIKKNIMEKKYISQIFTNVLNL